jgi:hypothetical protein
MNIISKKLLYSSTNYNIFLCNYTFWLSIKLLFSILNGFNIYSFLLGILLWSFWEYIYHCFILHALKNTD